MNANLRLVDLVDSRKPVIIGAPPAHDSKLTKARRLFYNGKSDYKGPDCLPNTAMTRIKKQVGGGKAAKGMGNDGNEDAVLSLSPLPTSMTLRSTLHMGVKRSAESTFQERDSSPPQVAPKARHGCRKLEVVLPTKPRKRMPSVITLSGSEEGSGDPAELFVSDDEEDPSTRKCKAKSQQSSHATKRVALSPDGDTTHRTAPGVIKASAQVKSVMEKTRFRIPSPLDSQSSGEEPEGHSPEGHRRTAIPAPKSLCLEQCKWSLVCNKFLTS